MEPPFKTYITRQRAADEHLQSLPKTAALEQYYNLTRAVSTSISHAWDLHSLLIKPVQRLLKYPLLLAAIIDETPDTHPDKHNLIQARTKIEQVARNVNEERRRAEVVKDVLSASKKPPRPLVKMRSIRNPSTRSLSADVAENEEALLVSRLSSQLRLIELFAQQFARNILDWAKAMSVVIRSLRTWSHSFAKVIGLSEENTSEAFEAFLDVVEKSLIPLCVDLENVINERLLKDLAHLLTTMGKPFKLIASMEEHQVSHFLLLNMNVSPKNRPPPSLMEASSNYLALRGQLAKELPRYVELVHKGIAIFIIKLAEIQKSFYADVRDRWGELWEMLRVEGEINAGQEETISVWASRWKDVETVVDSLAITNARRIYVEPTPPPETPTKKDGVVGMLMSLEPAVSAPYPLSPKPRGRGSSTSSTARRRPSADSLRRTKRRQPTFEDITDELDLMEYFTNLNMTAESSSPTLTRMKSMPLKAQHSPQSTPDRPNVKRRVSEQLSTSPGGSGVVTRHRPSGSVSSGGSSQHRHHPPSSLMQSQTSSTQLVSPGKYICKVIHPFRPQYPISYACPYLNTPSAGSNGSPHPHSYPFLDLRNGEFLEVIEEVGHPGCHPGLPIMLDFEDDEEGEDCLLLCRRFSDRDRYVDRERETGWALASFLKIVE